MSKTSYDVALTEAETYAAKFRAEDLLTLQHGELKTLRTALAIAWLEGRGHELQIQLEELKK